MRATKAQAIGQTQVNRVEPVEQKNYWSRTEEMINEIGQYLSSIDSYVTELTGRMVGNIPIDSISVNTVPADKAEGHMYEFEAHLRNLRAFAYNVKDRVEKNTTAILNA